MKDVALLIADEVAKLERPDLCALAQWRNRINGDVHYPREDPCYGCGRAIVLTDDILYGDYCMDCDRMFCNFECEVCPEPHECYKKLVKCLLTGYSFCSDCITKPLEGSSRCNWRVHGCPCTQSAFLDVPRDVWRLIAPHIPDRSTWSSFAQICKSTAKITHEKKEWAQHHFRRPVIRLISYQSVFGAVKCSSGLNPKKLIEEIKESSFRCYFDQFLIVHEKKQIDIYFDHYFNVLQQKKIITICLNHSE